MSGQGSWVSYVECLLQSCKLGRLARAALQGYKLGGLARAAALALCKGCSLADLPGSGVARRLLHAKQVIGNFLHSFYHGMSCGSKIEA